MYVQHVLYRLEKKSVFFYNEKNNSRWTSSSLVVVHCTVYILILQELLLKESIQLNG